MLRALERGFEPAVIVAMPSAIIVLVFADAVANELVRFAFVYMIYFGASCAIRERRHLRVAVLLDAVGPGARRWPLAVAEGVSLL